MADADAIKAVYWRIDGGDWKSLPGGASFRVPLPLESLRSGSWSVADSWSLHPDKDTYYALASSNSKAARALARHIDQLPGRCSASIRGGLEGEELQRWLEELSEIMDRWDSEFDWQSIRVRNVY